MFGKMILGGILGGIILFAWGAISWMALPFHMQSMHGFKDEAAVIQVIKTNATDTGVYFLPLQHSNAGQSSMSGPLIFAAVSQEGMPSMFPSLIRGLISEIIAAFLVTWLVLQAVNLGYFCRLFFIMVFAVAGSILTHFEYWNWFHFALDFTSVEIVDVLIGWFLAGLVIAGIAKRKTA